MDYSFNGKLRKTLVLRLFFGEELAFYFDARANFNSFTESLVFIRGMVPGDSYYNDPGAPAVHIDQQVTYNSIYPGFYLGFMPHLSEHLFLDWNIGFDLPSARAMRMSHLVPNDRTGGVLKYTTLSNPFDGSFTIWSTSLGIGYFF